MTKRFNPRCSAVPLTLVSLAAIGLGYSFLTVDREILALHRAATQYEDQYYDRTIEICQQILADNPQQLQARMLLANSFSQLGKRSDAIREYQTILNEAPAPEIELIAEFGLGEIAYYQVRQDVAEKHYKRVLEIDPHHLDANQRLGYLLQIQARTWESLPYVMEVIRQGKFKADELVMLGVPHALWLGDKDRVYRFLTELPEDAMLRFASIRERFVRNSSDDLQTPLRALIRKNPDSTEPKVLLGELLLKSGQDDEFQNWIETHGPALDSHPQFWVTVGSWLRDRNPNLAARCYLRGLECAPRHIGASFQLSQLADQFQQAESRQLAKKAIEDSEIDFLLFELRSAPDLEMIQKLVTHLLRQGRYWETAAWCQLILRFNPDELWAKETFFKAHENLNSVDFDRELRSLPNRIAEFGLQPISLTELLASLDGSNESISPTPFASKEIGDTPISFAELGAEEGLDFQYYNGTTAETGLVHIIQATGGAAAVIDYDNDGWPDLYFAQSGEWPVDPATNPYRDKLFRNLGNGQFRDVTAQAGLGDGYFSQGAMVGDLDNDGDSDLLLTNIGPNRIYWNQGDGTFRDQLLDDPNDDPVWSMSAAMADLNNDGLLDLYIVNYLELQAVMDRACKHQGQPRGCSPTMFTGEQDRVWLNLGDGTFRDVTREYGFAQKGGKGLGIVAADFDGDSEVEIFVGNDTAANFFFDRSTSQSGNSPRYENSGILCGVGLSSDGKAQASMGIASGDLNRDGSLDLFITNFYGDANIYYSGEGNSQSFRDRTRETNLYDSGFNLLGFGTQALDLERDGDLDLVLLNGHIDRTFATGEPDRMRPQILVNTGKSYTEHLSVTSGSYFQEKYFGRSLARGDFNRDGSDDLAVTHLDQSAKVLLNQTPPEKGYLRVLLVGTKSPRWPVGATVRLIQGDSVQTAWVTSGDGYLSCNENSLAFSANRGDEAELQIDWPFGKQSRFEQVPVDCELMVIEDRGQFLSK